MNMEEFLALFHIPSVSISPADMMRSKLINVPENCVIMITPNSFKISGRVASVLINIMSSTDTCIDDDNIFILTIDGRRIELAHTVLPGIWVSSRHWY